MKSDLDWTQGRWNDGCRCIVCCGLVGTGVIDLSAAILGAAAVRDAVNAEVYCRRALGSDLQRIEDLVIIMIYGYEMEALG